ncbi:MAG TPA: archaeal proteasome endopeptidase complex subunit alpha, partial [Methanocorpusculum sp.]|nr:archaeal proteasome endopeptidase complex subunit alpha [Methanocorpusculum sp.]
GGYDRTITMFSPDGRLYQVEYARESVNRGTTAVGIKCKTGVILLVDKQVNSKLIEPQSIEKIYMIDEHIGVATSGLVGDARILVDRARIEAQINRVSYGEPIDVESLAKKLCDHMQTYTLFGGARPYGTALLIAGVEKEGDNVRYRLFETDPSGALLEYKATSIGFGRVAAMKILESKYKENMTIDEAINLGLETLYGATDGKFDVNNVEISVTGNYQKNTQTNTKKSKNQGKIAFQKLNLEDLKTVISQFTKNKSKIKVNKSKK